MKLGEIKKPYDSIISLGSACDPAIHLRRRGLRKQAFPFDWVFTPSLKDVTKLFDQRFHNYMILENMKVIEGSAQALNEHGEPQQAKSYLIKDFYSNITSVHDFPIIPGKKWDSTYSSYKEKLNKRISRLFQTLSTSRNILFIRWNLDRNINEVDEFIKVLQQTTKAECNLLIINPTNPQKGVIDVNFNKKNVCVVSVPDNLYDTQMWDYILEGITLIR